MAQQKLSANDVLQMLEAHRLGTKKNGFEKFSSAVYASREKVMSLLVMYAGIGVAKLTKTKGAQLMHELLSHYENLVKRFEEGYGSYAMPTLYKLCFRSSNKSSCQLVLKQKRKHWYQRTCESAHLAFGVSKYTCVDAI